MVLYNFTIVFFFQINIVPMWRGIVYLQQNEHVGMSQHPCQHCEKTYSSGWDLKNHIKVVHGPDKLKCPDCNLCFAKKYNLREHVKTGVCNPTVAASYREQNSCPYCGRTFLARKSLKRHMSSVHPNKKNNDVCVDNLIEDRDWQQSVLTNFSHIKSRHFPEKTYNLYNEEKSDQNKGNVLEFEDIDNIDKVEEKTIEIDLGTNQVFNIDSMIEEVSIDTMEEGDVIENESIASYITEVNCTEGDTAILGP